MGRCDARCYNAKGTVCKCICGGINHGCGLNIAHGNINSNEFDNLQLNQDYRLMINKKIQLELFE